MEENWNAETCLAHNWSNLTEEGSLCPPIWDGFTCWEPTANGSTAWSRCPNFKGSDITKFAHRICSPTGEWQDRYENYSLSGWTNYTSCLTPEIREVMRRLGSNDDAQAKLNIAKNTRVLEFVGLSFSLVALLLSLFIFYFFRTLRNSRTKLHRHLFFAMVIQVAIRLIVYTDQAITRSIDSVSSDHIANASDYLHPHNSGESLMPQHRRGIDNTPILCEASYICLEYARTVMFMWMFIEGLYLHNLIAGSVFEQRVSPLLYPVIGWIVPVPLTVTWAVVTHFHYGKATCWWGYNLTVYFWILEGPRLVVLLINLAFLLNILRVVVTKLRKSNSSDMQQAMKAVKAALVLLPLFGLTNLLNMLDAPLEKPPFQFGLWSYTTHLLTSTQGLVLAILYCFKNGEVQTAVRKYIRIHIFDNPKHPALTKNVMPIPISVILKSCVNPSDDDDSHLENMLSVESDSNPTIILVKHIRGPPNFVSYNRNLNASQMPIKCISENCNLSTTDDISSGRSCSIGHSISNGFLMQSGLPKQFTLRKNVCQKL